MADHGDVANPVGPFEDRPEQAGLAVLQVPAQGAGADSQESRRVPTIPFVVLAVLLLQPHLLTEGRDDEHQGKQRMGYPEEFGVRDDAQAQEEDVVSEVLRVAREPVGAGGDEAVPEARGILPADRDDSPDRKQSSQ